MATESVDWLRETIRKSAGWILPTIVLSVLPFTEFFIPLHSSPDNRVFGWGYYGYMLIDLGLYLLLLLDTFRTTKRLAGVRRLELQVWLLGGCVATSLILITMGLNAITSDRVYIRLQPLIILVFYAGTILAITTNRIFDARQIILVVTEKIVLVSAVAAVAFFSDWTFKLFLPSPLDWLPTVTIVLWFAAALNGWLDRLLHFFPEAAAARRAAFDVSQRESRVESLLKAFRAVLSGWGQSDQVVIISGTKEGLVETDTLERCDDGVVKTMRQLGWATPERLTRERPTPERAALAQYLAERNFGVLVISEGPALTTIVGVGVSASRRPFTFPQVTQLLELASIMEGALERAHFSAKAQHSEQLATVGLLGASLAHEIRNPLVTIKTFVQLLPKHHQDPVFREKFFRLIGDEVTRIDQLTEQLLDLASPRTYEAKMIALHPVLKASLDLVAAKAAHKNVRFFTDFQAAPDGAFTDASAAKQVMLNLCFNAIQAVEACDGDRWVRISTRNIEAGVEMAVADSGPGIAAEIRAKLFQPFQTTKSTGFGLGLAICSDILGNLNARIEVDPPALGQGAVFRVTFPCQPLSS